MVMTCRALSCTVLYGPILFCPALPCSFMYFHVLPRSVPPHPLSFHPSPPRPPRPTLSCPVLLPCYQVRNELTSAEFALNLNGKSGSVGTLPRGTATTSSGGSTSSRSSGGGGGGGSGGGGKSEIDYDSIAERLEASLRTLQAGRPLSLLEAISQDEVGGVQAGGGNHGHAWPAGVGGAAVQWSIIDSDMRFGKYIRGEELRRGWRSMFVGGIGMGLWGRWLGVGRGSRVGGGGVLSLCMAVVV